MPHLRTTPAGRRVWAEVASPSGTILTVTDWTTHDRVAVSVDEGFDNLLIALDEKQAAKVRDALDEWLRAEV